MAGPPPRTRTTTLGTVLGSTVLLALLALLALPAAAQQAPGGVPTTGFSLYLDALLGGLGTLLLGGGLIVLAPEVTERTTDLVLEEPGETFLYGLGIFVAALVAAVLLLITVVGIVLVIPLVVALAVVGQFGYLAAGRAVTDDWGPVLLVATAVSAFASGVPLLGGLVGFVLACAGTGAWYLEYRDGGRASSGGGPTGSDVVTGGSVGKTTTRSDVTGEWGRTDDGDAASDDEWTAGFDDGPDRE